MQMQPNNRPALIPLISPKETLKIASREAESGTYPTLANRLALALKCQQRSFIKDQLTSPIPPVLANKEAVQSTVSALY